MSLCCRSTGPPEIRKLGDRMSSSPEGVIPSNGLSEESSELLAATLCSVPPLASRELKGLIADLRDHQERMFAQVLNQQHIFQKQLDSIESGIRATTNAQIVSNRRQEDFFTEIRDLSFKAEAVSCEEKDVKTVETPSKAPPDNKSSHRNSKSSHLSHEQLLDNARDIASKASKLKNMLGAHSSDGHSKKSPRERARRLLQTKEFEIATAAAILINSFIMCWESQYHGLDVGYNLKFAGRSVQAHVVWEGAEPIFMWFDWFFGGLFLLEMVVKIACLRHNYFFEPPSSPSGFFHVEQSSREHSWWSRCSLFFHSIQGWNLLDLFSVCAFLIDKVGTDGIIKPQLIRLLRLSKLGRLVRLLRFVESLDHLYVMTTAISALTRILLWAIMLLSLMLLTCDLFLVQVLQAIYFDQVKADDLTDDELQKYHNMYAYFGTCSRCMLSMFEITLGNWPPIARLLSEEVSEWFAVICLAHKLTIGFAVIGVINGCILQETFKVAQTDDFIMFRQKKKAGRVMQMKMNALYEALDVSCDGELELAEVESISLLPEIKVWLSSLGIETGDLRMLFDLLDENEDGRITLDELCKRMPRIQGTARSIDVLAMQKQLWKSFEGEDGQKIRGDTSCFADYLIAA